MPRYFFHLHNDLETRDEEGLSLANLEEAKAVAFREARVLAAHSVLGGHFQRSHAIKIADASSATILVVRFDEAVTISD